MATRARGQRWQRLGVMVLVPSLTVVTLAAQPPYPDGAPRPTVVELPPGATPAGAAASGPGTLPRHAAADRPAPASTDRVEWDEAEADSTPETGWPAEAAPLAPDVVVALEQPGSVSGLPLPDVPPAYPADDAQPVPRAVVVDAAAGPGDGMEGLEPGARYWFGPQGLEKTQVSMEAQ
jgi:hypothetical protein